MQSGAFANILFAFMITISSANTNFNKNSTDISIIEASQRLLLQAQTDDSTDSLVKVIKVVREEKLTRQLKDDNYKKAFWINVYNVFTQIILSKNPYRYKNRRSFFSDKEIIVAGKQLSLDDIEHGILRHSKIKWSPGYLNKWFPCAFEKQQRVNTLDYRIHFALNCGAKSCPPIAFYKPEQLDKQLDMAAKVYLQGEAGYKEADNTVALPAIMGMVQRRFWGKEKNG